MNALACKDGFVPKGNGITPKFMIRGIDELAHLADQITGQELHCPAVSGIGHDAYSSVFRERTTGPAIFAMHCPPTMRPLMKCVIGIKQRNDHIDIQQCPHRFRFPPDPSTFGHAPESQPHRATATMEPPRESPAISFFRARESSTLVELRRKECGRRYSLHAAQVLSRPAKYLPRYPTWFSCI